MLNSEELKELKEEWEDYEKKQEIKLEIFNKFHKLFQINGLGKLELDKYTNLTSKKIEYFANWVEKKTKQYGRCSGNSFNIGVYKPNPNNVKPEKLGNDDARIKKWEKNAEVGYKTREQERDYETFVNLAEANIYYTNNVREKLVELSKFADLEDIGPLGINFSRKIAYLYNPGKMLSFYSNKPIEKLATLLDVEIKIGDYKATCPILFKLQALEFLPEKMPDNKSQALEQTLKLSNFLNQKYDLVGKNDKNDDNIEVMSDKTLNRNRILDRAPNRILYGPPGTGKTRESIEQAAEIINDFQEFNSYKDAQRLFNTHLHKRIEFITFHQNYSYEDFVQGIRPDTENNRNLIFEQRDGIFKKLADEALRNYKNSTEGNGNNNLIAFDEVFDQFSEQLITEGGEVKIKMKTDISFSIYDINEKSIFFEKQQGSRDHSLSISTLKGLYEGTRTNIPRGLSSYYLPLIEKLKEIGGQTADDNETKVELKNFVLVIDEINRANISRVFGELITLIEEDKRYGQDTPLSVKLPSGEEFIVPPNLYIIGTMNTADKSIALLDIALRRRFKFIPLYPEYVIDGHDIYNVEILQDINNKIIETKGHDFQIGHSYFMKDENLQDLMNTKIIPLLLEYYMNDTEKVKEILGAAGLTTVPDRFPLEI